MRDLVGLNYALPTVPMLPVVCQLMAHALAFNLMAFVFDHLLHPVHQVQIVEIVHVSDVAGFQPLFPGFLVDAKRFFRGLGIVEITQKSRGCLNKQLARPLLLPTNDV